MTTRRYAERTKVSEAKSRQEVEAELERHHCDQVAVMTESRGVHFGFAKDGRLYRVGIDLPLAGVSRANDQERRRRMRTLALWVKARLNAVEDGLRSFEDEFVTETVMDDGRTLREHAGEQLQQIEAHGNRPRRLLLPGATE